LYSDRRVPGRAHRTGRITGGKLEMRRGPMYSHDVGFLRRHLTSLLAASVVLAGSSAAAQVIAIENVTLIDGTGRPAVAGSFVLIENGRIARVSTEPIQTPSGAQRIDGRGKYLIPGLMDMHVHLRGGRGGGGADDQVGIRHLQSYLYAGVTSIYDAGNAPEFILSLRDRERSGRIVSPRIFATGGIVTFPGSHGSGEGATLVDSWPAAIPKLDAHIAQTPDVLKVTYEERGWGIRPLIPRLPWELMQKIVQYYNDRGIRTTAHTSSELQAREAIAAGIDTLAHPVIQGPVTDAFVHLMATKGIPMVSTLTIGEGYSRLADDPGFLDQPLYRAVIEPEEIQRLKTEESARQRENRWAAWMKLMTPVCQDNLRKIHEGGGIIALGTDQSIGPAVHREMELLVAGGISPLEVITIATRNAAIYLGREREMGTVEPGKLADLVLLDGDPLVDINNAKLIHTVIKDGQVIDRSKLDLPVNRKPE
jgi:imidazolonepropionase-like amidohydrolase